MANRPHPDRKAVTWRLHRDLVNRVKATAAGHGETVLDLVTRALTRELEGPVKVETAANTCAECGDVICPACGQHNIGHCQECWACPGDRHDECCEG